MPEDRTYQDLSALNRPTVQASNAGIPVEHQLILSRTLAPNGLAWREINCQRCGHHLGDDGILIGCYRKKCPKCKFPNIIEVNRVGEQQELEDYYGERGKDNG